MDAIFYDADEKISVPARDLPRSLVERLRPLSQDLGCENELLRVLEIVEGGTGSQRQRQVYEESGDFLDVRSEEHTSELQSRQYLVCRLLLEKQTYLDDDA